MSEAHSFSQTSKLLVSRQRRQLTGGMSSEALCPRALEVRDAAALIGLLAVLTGESMLGQLGEELSESLQKRLVREGLATSPASPVVLQRALSDLVERLRYALGEYAAPPLPAGL